MQSVFHSSVTESCGKYKQVVIMVILLIPRLQQSDFSSWNSGIFLLFKMLANHPTRWFSAIDYRLAFS
jgi:hypothetical protein